MNFLQKPVGVRDDGKSVFNHFKKTAMFNEIQSYETVKCNRGWWKIITMTIGGYEHHTDALYHFDCGKCDLVVANPTLSFLDSLELHEDTQYSRDFDSQFDRVVFLCEPVNECDIVNYLEKKYSITGLFQEAKRNDKVLIGKREDGPICEFSEDPGCLDFCIAKVQDGMVEMVLLAPSPEVMEYWFFQM